MLALKGVSCTYPSSKTPAVADVDLSLERGRRIALVGLNGSGKSTLLRVACGLMRPDAGAVELAGEPVDYTSAQSLWNLHAHVSLVGQDPDDQIVSTTVFEEVAFGPCNLGLPRDEIQRRCEAALEQCLIGDLADRIIETLSGGQRQRVCLAGAVALAPDVLLLDEPCSMLDAVARQHMLEAIDKAARSGATVVHATHELEDVLSYDEIVVMEAGRVIWRGTPRGFLAEPRMIERSGVLTSRWTRLLSDALACGALPHGMDLLDGAACARAIGADLGLRLIERSTRRSATGGWPVRCAGHRMSARALEFSPAGDGSARIDFPDFELAGGEGLLVSGPSGSGKTTLVRLLAGLVAPDAGEVLVDGEHPHAGLVACGFQRPAIQLFADSVLEDVAFGPRNMGWARDEALDAAARWLRVCGLDPDVFGDRSPWALSGGQARRAALAGVLAMERPFVVLDEPTVGLDARGLEALLGVLQDLLAKGAGLVVATHDAQRLGGLCGQEAAVGSRDRLAAPRHQAFEQELASMIGSLRSDAP